MSFFGGLFGSSKPADEPSSSQELFNSATFSSAARPASAGAGAVPGDNINAPAPPSSIPAYTPSASDLFASAYDPAKLHPLAGISDNLEVLQLDDDKLSDVQGAQGVLPSRGWTDDLCVGTGTTYASGELLRYTQTYAIFICKRDGQTDRSGLAVGGLWGLKEGWTRPLGNNTSFKLRLNAILNACSRRGSFTGNSLGVLGTSASQSHASMALDS